MENKLEIEEVLDVRSDLIDYFERDIIRNALNIWSLKKERNRSKVFVCRKDGEIKAHLSKYDTPEAIYTDLGGEAIYAEALISLVPPKAVVTTPIDLGDLIRKTLKCDAIYSNDLMMVKRGEERLRNPDNAVRLDRESKIEYSTFGSSFNLREIPLDWVRERLKKNIIFGVFENGKLASVASLSAWLDEVAVILGVETKPEFRRKGLASAVVSAAVREGLKRSKSCTLFVRSDNHQAIALYNSIGFQYYGNGLWIDVGTGLMP